MVPGLKMNKIRTLLIANRGEIACRVIRTAKRLGIKTVAIYADVDRNALHCQLADEAYCVGTVPAEKSYLNMHNILSIAKQCRADAIHPGYGFLSENASFAALSEQHGFIFVGPSSNAIAKMAVKDEAKKIMQQANVPTTPGYMGQDQDVFTLTQAANEIGFPLILKAAKGGGGKGMRVVHHAKDLAEIIASAKRESMMSFGDDTLFIEKYLQHARHIEVQIFRDKAGNAVHLFERDCSLQRRHQKIIEESPAIEILDEIKQKLFQAAINCAHAIDYVGAGTVEFLYSSDHQFYFMEMNTRLQVEHPVTEMITGLDLVEWQLRIADGEELPLSQTEITANGHAIEARIYAEDPIHHFLPATGTIKKIILPETENYRLDSGIREKDKISIYFDPLLAKMIVHAANRIEAINTLHQVLDQYHILGLTTNLPFLRKILLDKAFQSAKIHTQYVETHLIKLLPTATTLTKESIIQACLIYLLHRKTHALAALEYYSPWDKCNAWRLNLPHKEILHLQYQEEDLIVDVEHTGENTFQLSCSDKQIDVHVGGELLHNKLHFYSSSQQGVVDFYIDEEEIVLFPEGKEIIFTFTTHAADPEVLQITNHHLLAPMPGIITKIWISPGDNVLAGSKLLALEAMKMEHTLCAPKDGLIKSIHFQVGDQVEERCQLIDFE